MATVSSDTIEKITQAIFRAVQTGAIALERTTDGKAILAQGNADGHMLVEVSAAELPTGAATQTTLAAILAKLIAAPATEANQAAANIILATMASYTGGVRHATAPDVADLSVGRVAEVDRSGAQRISADLYNFAHQMHLVATGAAAQAAFVRAAPAYPFDGLWVGTDDVVVFGQPRGRAYHVPDGLTFADGAAWTTAGTDWTIASSKATHAASAGGTDDLVPVAMGAALEVGKTYVVYTKVVHRGGTGVTAYVGTQAGTQITATGEHVQALVCTGSSSAKLTATDDWDGDVLAYQIYTHTPKLASRSYMPFALTEIVGVAAASALTTLLVATACDVHGLYRRAPGSVDLG